MSGTLPRWIERLLGEEPGPGEGTVWTLQYSWPWPPWVTLLFVTFAMALVVGLYLREGRSAGRPYRIMLAALRMAVVAMVVMMIAQLAVSRQRTGLPYVAVLVDDSLSMTIVDRYEPKQRAKLQQRIARGASPGDSTEPVELSRWNLARMLLTEQDSKMLSAIAEDYKLRVYFLTGVRPVPQKQGRESGVAELAEEIRSLSPGGESSRLGSGVRRVLDDLRGTAPAGVVLLTDGINTDGPPLADAAAMARRKGVPLFIVGLGSNRPVKDIKLSDLLVDPLVFVDDVVSFQFNVTGTGFAGESVRVVLRREGEPSELAGMDVSVGPDGQPQPVRLPYRPAEAGRFRYVVEVQPQPDELQTDNNREVRQVEVRKEQISVLLAQTYPSYEFRYLQRMLDRDDTIDLKYLLQEADLEYAEQDPAALSVFPVGRDDLFSYDVIILGDLDPATLSASMMQNLVDFVDRPGKGGALVLIAGPEYMPDAYRNTPLEGLMPIHIGSVRYPDLERPITEGFLMQPTRFGIDSPPMQLGDTPAATRKIWSRLPPLYWLAEVHDLKPATRVLAEHPSGRSADGHPLPVVCMHYVGAGKAVFHATDETWRWRKRVGDVFFARYWIQMIRYLSRSKLASGEEATLTTDRREYTPEDRVRLRVRFVDDTQAPAEHDGVTVVLEHQGHKTRRVRLRRTGTGRGVFEGVLSRPQVGNYHAWVAIPAVAGRAPAADFVVLAPPGEFQRVSADTRAMRSAAQRTKGGFYDVETAAGLVKDLPRGRPAPIGPATHDSLWNKWPVLLLFLFLLITEWVLRKLGGMV